MPLRPGDACPECGQGTVYDMQRPGVLVRITGQPPVGAKVYRLQKLRCHLCGKLFTARPPEGVGVAKYDAAAGSMIALLKYGSGMPFNRLAGLQGKLGIPLPASTQWEIVLELARHLEPIYAELIRQAAGGEVVYNDDTTVKILEWMGKRAQQQASAEEQAEQPAAAQKPRKGLFTSGIVSTRPASGCPGRRIALFFSGRKHAGENLQDVLCQRAAELGPPIQMCDALSRNLPGELQTILAHPVAASQVCCACCRRACLWNAGVDRARVRQSADRRAQNLARPAHARDEKQPVEPLFRLAPSTHDSVPTAGLQKAAALLALAVRCPLSAFGLLLLTHFRRSILRPRKILRIGKRFVYEFLVGRSPARRHHRARLLRFELAQSLFDFRSVHEQPPKQAGAVVFQHGGHGAGINRQIGRTKPVLGGIEGLTEAQFLPDSLAVGVVHHVQTFLRGLGGIDESRQRGRRGDRGPHMRS